MKPPPWVGGAKMKRPRSPSVGEDVQPQAVCPRWGCRLGRPLQGGVWQHLKAQRLCPLRVNSPPQVGLQGPRVCAHSSVHGGTAHKQEGPRKPVDGRVSEPGSREPRVHGAERRKPDPGGNTSSNSKVRRAVSLHQETEGGYLHGRQGCGQSGGTGRPFWGPETPESPSGYTGTVNIKVIPVCL